MSEVPGAWHNEESEDNASEAKEKEGEMSKVTRRPVTDIEMIQLPGGRWVSRTEALNDETVSMEDVIRQEVADNLRHMRRDDATDAMRHTINAARPVWAYGTVRRMEHDGVGFVDGGCGE